MNVNITKIQRLSNGIVQFYNGADIVDSFSITSSVSIGFESNSAKTIVFSNNVKTLSFNVYNVISVFGSTGNKTYSSGIDPSDTSSAYISRLYEIYALLISDVIQGCCPGPTFVGGVVAAYPNFASFPATGQRSVIYIDEADNSAYYWNGTSYQLLVSTGVEQYATFASFPVTGSANVIYIDMSGPKPYVWNGTAYESIGGDVVWGSITGTLSAQTDLQAALDAKQDTLVSGTNIKTINGASVLGSGDLVVGGSTSLAVGTTPITSGTIGRVLFEGTGNVLQQNANLFWDNTNGWLGIGTASPTTPLEVIGRVTLGRDAAVTTQIVSIIQAKDTNGGIVLLPNGTGSILANVPDGTATGGNARGANSVDLQMSRTTAAQVALSAFCVIGGGKGNSILGGHEGHVVAGGDRNAISFGSYNTISGGQLNTAGDAAGRFYTTVVGGRSNFARGAGSTVGGEQNNVGLNATDSTAFGRLITITGAFSGGMGYNFSMSGDASFGLTINARSTAGATTLLGVEGHAYLPSQLVHGTNYLSPVFEGTYQSSQILPKTTATLTTGQTSAIILPGNTLIIPTGTNRIWNVEINTTAVVTAITGTATGVAVGDVYTETKKLCFKRVGGVSSIVGIVDTVYVKSDGGMTTASVTAAAGASQSLALTFTAPIFVGGGSVSVRVLSKVELVEVAY